MPIPKPTEITLSQVEAKSPDEIQNLLATHGVAIIALDDISTLDRNNAVNSTKFYQNANAIFDGHSIEEPTLLEKLMVKKFKARKAPDSASGMIHQYFTPIHHLLHSSNTLMSIFDTLTDGTTIYAPNRLRISHRFKFNDNSLHIEGKNIFEVKDDTIKLLPGDIACIAGIAGQRRFVFWDMNGADLKPIYDLWVANGSKNWTQPDPIWMQQHYGGRRKMVTVDCSKKPYLILWSESTPHEIACSPSLSAFISPIEKFDTKIITKNTMTSYHPPEFEGLTRHETNLLACCYNMPGFTWPSGKKAYAFCHSRAYGFYMKRLRERYTKTNSQGRLTYQQRIIDIGTIDQHSVEYQNKLRDRGIVLPSIAFADTTPNFVVDILSLPEQTLRNYGFIPTTVSNKKYANSIISAGFNH